MSNTIGIISYVSRSGSILDSHHFILVNQCPHVSPKIWKWALMKRKVSSGGEKKNHTHTHTHTNTMMSGVQVNCGEHTQALVNSNMRTAQEMSHLWWKVTQSVVNIQVSYSEHRGELCWTDRSVNRQGHGCEQAQKLWWIDRWAVFNGHVSSSEKMWALVNRRWPVAMNREVSCSGHMSSGQQTRELWWKDTGPLVNEQVSPPYLYN
jgi:hypothetical protein